MTNFEACSCESKTLTEKCKLQCSEMTNSSKQIKIKFTLPEDKILPIKEKNYELEKVMPIHNIREVKNKNIESF